MDLGSLLIISSVAQSPPFQPFGFPTWVFKPLVRKAPKRLTSYFWALWTNEFSNRESCSEQTNAGARNQFCALPIGSEGRIAPGDLEKVLLACGLRPVVSRSKKLRDRPCAKAVT